MPFHRGADGPVRHRAVLVVPFLLTVVLFLLPAWDSPAVAGVPHSPAAGTDAGAPNPRDDEPVLLTGAQFPELDGTLLADTGLFVYDPAIPGYRPIPFQWDERVDRVFNEGSPFEFHQLLYDFEHEEDGRLDADDELAFMYRDAGQRAPAAGWPSPGRFRPPRSTTAGRRGSSTTPRTTTRPR